MTTKPDKALIVDDDILVCKVLERILTLRGMKTIIASNGNDAKTALIKESSNIAIAVIDLVLPNGATGWDIIEFIRNESQSPKIPIVVLTGAGVSVQEAEKLQKKVSCIVRKKDFNVDAFKLVIDEALGGTNR